MYYTVVEPDRLFDVRESLRERKYKLYHPSFNKGDKVSLASEPCEGFEQKERVYEIVGKVYEFNELPINSYVVKQISGEKGIIFSLTKEDCKLLNVEYERGLQLLPIGLNWKIPSDIKKILEGEIKELSDREYALEQESIERSKKRRMERELKMKELELQVRSDSEELIKQGKAWANTLLWQFKSGRLRVE